ncbi:MAG: YggT family protein [Chloroflexota bacterium]
MLGYILSRAIDFYSLIILFWVITSWFPRLRRHEIVRTVGRACEPVLGVARRIIPSSGGIDLSPMLVIILLQVLAGVLRRLAF